MSYFPNYLSQTDKLDENDRAFVKGFEWAIECAKTFFTNTEVFDSTKEEQKVLESDDTIGCFEQWMKSDECVLLVSLFDKEKYEGVELVDENDMYPSLNKGNSDEK